MGLGSVFLLLAFLVVIVLFISRPFFNNGNNKPEPQSGSLDHERSTLLAERDRILNSIHELDLDFDLGKMPPEDYRRQRTALLETGAGVLRELDNLPASGDPTLSGGHFPDASESLQASPVGTEINTPANSRRKVPASDPNDELEAIIASRRRSRNEKASGFCPKCGGPLQKSDQFCSKCGFKLPRPVSEQG